ncbi:hypothetical protein GM415_12730 [Pseudodesulfovibrio cashew]|uniref:Uncharacterized protein n=1 Tax=Pseudodesulfovibrio cashew TaxID=2678688 RepID=A0A6I6JDN7_9BACT|nr:hypothetical protein [Pseudodesulfovibrio cashew]QGY40955.1 hypothetical protein GM415_12730 [Pseudodesulfovibrio cashew]
MLDISTLSLLIVMVVFICVAMIMVHYHSNSDQVRRKKNEVASYSQKLSQKIDVVEKEIIDLKVKIETLDEEIDILSN